MMRILPVFLVFVCVIAAVPAAGASVSSRELIENAADYDGKTVVYSGEVVGELMQRGDFVWINVLDGPSAIGVWAAKNAAAVIKHAGSYKFRGDTVEVEGIFNARCARHGGDLDIHAKKIRIITPGSRIARVADNSRIVSVLAWIAIAGFLWILKRLKDRSSRI